MPELPDLTVYVEALAARVGGEPLLGVRLANPFLLRTAAPPIAEAAGKRVADVRRMGKRILRAESGTNSCPRCQTSGQVLSDRSLARLLKDDWPRTLEELERLEALPGQRRE